MEIQYEMKHEDAMKVVIGRKVFTRKVDRKQHKVRRRNRE
jgi:hypothetical protein